MSWVVSQQGLALMGWRANHREYLLATARTLSLPDEQFRAVADEDAAAVVESIRQTFGAATPWWPDPPAQQHQQLACWSRRLPEDQSFRLITQVVPDPWETVWFLAFAFGENGVVFEAVPTAVEKLLGETYLFEYAVVCKQRNWLLGEEHHSVFIGVGSHVVARLREIIGPSGPK